MKNIDKKELHNIFEGISNKDEKEFNGLYEKYNKLIYAIAFSILKNKENSEDIVQIVLTKIWNMNVENLPTSNEATWLYSLTKNEALNFLRKQRNEINLEEVYYVIDNNKELEEIIDKDAYNKILSKLDENEQEIVSLKILSKLSFKEISQILDMPIGTVQWRYYKALHTLKMLLSSLSMFILTIFAFILQRNRTKKEYIIKEETIEQEEQEKEVEIEKEEETDKKELENNRIEENETAKDIEMNEISKGEENYLIVEQEVEKKSDWVDIGLISTSIVFLIITIIFLIFYIKRQQKVRKKVSK